MTQKADKNQDVFAPRLWAVWKAAVLTVVGAISLLVGIYILTDRLVPSRPASSARTLDILKVTIALGGIVGAVLTGVYAYRKQKLSESDAQRADAEHLLGRFSKASDQLGQSDPATRLAGVYAMAALADTWPEQRQMCINVLTSYLQLPEPKISGADSHSFDGEVAVRRNLVRVIRDHLREGYSTVSWRGYNLRFEGARFYGGDFTGAHFTDAANITFHGAQFLDGTFYFNNVVIDGARVWFTNTSFAEGAVNFAGANLRSGLLDFSNASLGTATVSFDGFIQEGGQVKPGPFAHQPPFAP